MKPITKYTTYIIIALWAAACYAFFQTCYANHFFYQEQTQLFLWSSDYLSTYLGRPAWLACMLGDFLTQLYYYLYAGAAILTVCLLLVGDLTGRALRRAGVKGRWTSFLLALALMTVEAILCLDYNYRLSSVLAVAGGALLFWATPLYYTEKTARTVISALLHLFVALLCYVLFGMGVWLYLALTLLACCLHWKRGGVACHIAAVVLTVVVLLLSKKVYLLDHPRLLAYPGMGTLAAPQRSLEKTWDVENAYEFGNYQKVVSLVEEGLARSEADDEVNKYQKFYYNLVMAKRGLLTEKLLAIPHNDLGTLEQIGPETPTFTINCMSILYKELGDITFAERATLLALVSSPQNRNIRMVKRLAEIGIQAGDRQSAAKYLRILQRTLVWNSWATDQLALLEQAEKGVKDKGQAEGVNRIEGQQTGGPQTGVQSTNDSIADRLRLTQNAYPVLQELLKKTPDNQLALHYLLCTDLLLKDMETFKRDYDTFYLAQSAPRYEKLYQEALAIYLAGTNAPEEEWRKYIHRPDVISHFAAYNQQRGSAAFRDTYWYYFDKIEKLKN